MNPCSDQPFKYSFNIKCSAENANRLKKSIASKDTGAGLVLYTVSQDLSISVLPIKQTGPSEFSVDKDRFNSASWPEDQKRLLTEAVNNKDFMKLATS